jgi:membrane protease YdiL (CAAX protease family)
MIAIGLLLGIPIVLWLVQTGALVRHGLPVRLRIDQRGLPEGLRIVNRAVTQVCLAAIVLSYPLLISQSFVEYYARLLPSGAAVLHFVEGFCASCAFLGALFLGWLLTGRIEIDPHHSRKKTIRRLAMLVPTTLFGAFMEELLFRGIVMADLLRSPAVSGGAAVLISGAIFAVAHYLRPAKRYWTFPGHVVLGILLGTAFLRTHTLWLPAGLHAGGIFMIMGTRPFVRYRGPAWLSGASIFPFAGVVGIIGLGVLLSFVTGHYGVVQR